MVRGNLGSTDRLRNGLVLILPGIEGRSKYNSDILAGLNDGGVSCAIEIYDWTTILPMGALLNLTAIDRNKEQARLIAQRVVEYQNDYPERPVHMIGHSGGGGLAVLTLEALPPGHKVNSAILLAAAISPEYDLAKALSNTEAGIWNFYSNSDTGYLKVGTSLFGTIDRRHTRAAGAVGFRTPSTTRADTKNLYAKLHSVGYRDLMAYAGNRGSHAGWTDRRFVALWLAPVILTAGDGRAGYEIALDDSIEKKVGSDKWVITVAPKPTTAPTTTRSASAAPTTRTASGNTIPAAAKAGTQ